MDQGCDDPGTGIGEEHICLCQLLDAVISYTPAQGLSWRGGTQPRTRPWRSATLWTVFSRKGLAPRVRHGLCLCTCLPASWRWLHSYQRFSLRGESINVRGDLLGNPGGFRLSLTIGRSVSAVSPTHSPVRRVRTQQSTRGGFFPDSPFLPLSWSL